MAIAVFFVPWLALHPHQVSAQTSGQRGHSRTGAVLGSGSPGMLRMIWGRVVFEDGSVPTSEVPIEMVCRGRPFTVAQMESRGRFQFDVGRRSAGRGVLRIEPGCMLQAALTGYRSSQVFVRDPDAFETLDVGTIILYPAADQGSPTVSATTLRAPPRARDAYDKALKELGKKKHNSKKIVAELEKAVEEYPEFSEAWSLLGEARMAKGDPDAEAAFRNALAADPKLVAPYSALIRIELGRQRWAEASILAGNLLSLNPGDDQARFAFAVANFNLGDLDAAKSTAEKIQSGAGGASFPESNELLGHIHAQQGDFGSAARLPQVSERSARCAQRGKPRSSSR